MPSDIDMLTAELAVELKANTPGPVDPRTLPVRFSRLKLFQLSAAHYRQACQWAYASQDRTPAQRIGTAVHSLVLGSGATPVCFPGKRYGRAWDSFEAANQDKLILNEREFEDARSISAAVLTHPEAMALLHEGTTEEQAIAWKYLGRDCHSTPDACRREWVAELKTCQTAKPPWFIREALRYCYHVQLAAYTHAIEATIGHAPAACYIVAVEKRPPYVVQCFRLTERAIDQGRKIWRGWFEQLLACEQANAWGGYSETIVDFDLPADDPFAIEIDGQSIEV